MSCLHAANSFIESHKPWQLAKSAAASDQRALQCVVHVGLEAARVASLALWPIIPRLADRILSRLGVATDNVCWRHLTETYNTREHALGRDTGALLGRLVKH